MAPKKDIEFTLLENGLDFILSGLEQLEGKPEKRELKYSVIHIFSGIVLILKEKLNQEHWSLLFEDTNKANWKDYKSGDFISVNFDSCLSRLDGVCGAELDKKDKDILRVLKEKRNKIEHFNITENSSSIKGAISQSLDFILDFINDNFEAEDLSDIDNELINKIRSKLTHYKSYVRRRLKKIEPLLSTFHHLPLTCPDCQQKTLQAEEGFYCHFCRSKDLSCDSASDRYLSGVMGISGYSVVKDGGEWPVVECFECGEEALVTYTETGEGVCFSCGVPYASLDSCTRCGRVMLTDDESTVCSDCWQDIWERND